MLLQPLSTSLHPASAYPSAPGEAEAELTIPGFVGQKLTQLLLKLAPKHVKLITTDVVEPPNHGETDTNRLKVVKADLGKPEVVKSLFEGEKVGIVYALQCVYTPCISTVSRMRASARLHEPGGAERAVR